MKTYLNGFLPRCLVILSNRLFKKFAHKIARSLCFAVTIRMSSIFELPPQLSVERKKTIPLNTIVQVVRKQ